MLFFAVGAKKILQHYMKDSLNNILNMAVESYVSYVESGIISFDILSSPLDPPGLAKGEGDFQPKATQREAEATSTCPGGGLRHQEQHHQVRKGRKNSPWIFLGGFPDMGVYPNHQFNGFFHYKPTIFRYPRVWNPPCTMVKLR